MSNKQKYFLVCKCEYVSMKANHICLDKKINQNQRKKLLTYKWGILLSVFPCGWQEKDFLSILTLTKGIVVIARDKSGKYKKIMGEWLL